MYLYVLDRSLDKNRKKNLQDWVYPWAATLCEEKEVSLRKDFEVKKATSSH